MSKEIGYIKQKRNNELYITKFYGGTDRSVCIQLSQNNRYIEITVEDYFTLKKVLDDFFHSNVNLEQLQLSEFIVSEEE